MSGEACMISQAVSASSGLVYRDDMARQRTDVVNALASGAMPFLH